ATIGLHPAARVSDRASGRYRPLARLPDRRTLLLALRGACAQYATGCPDPVLVLLGLLSYAGVAFHRAARDRLRVWRGSGSAGDLSRRVYRRGRPCRTKLGPGEPVRCGASARTSLPAFHAPDPRAAGGEDCIATVRQRGSVNRQEYVAGDGDRCH